MKKLISKFAVILGFSLYCIGCYKGGDWDFGYTRMPDEHCNLKGVILDFATNEGVAGIEVGVKWDVTKDISAPAAYDSTFVMTDSNGNFSLSYFGPAIFQLIVNAPGYRGYYYLDEYYDIANQPYIQGKPFLKIRLFE